MVAADSHNVAKGVLRAERARRAALRVGRAARRAARARLQRRAAQEYPLALPCLPIPQ